MDTIGSNFKITPSSGINSGGGGSEIFSSSSGLKRAMTKENVISVVMVIVILAIAYFYRATLLKIYNAGIMDSVWSALYLTPKGEVATTYVPESSVANSIANLISSKMDESAVNAGME